MSYGLEIINNVNKILIDDTYSNLLIIEAGAAAVTYGGGSNNYVYANFNRNPEDIFFVRCSNPAVPIYCQADYIMASNTPIFSAMCFTTDSSVLIHYIRCRRASIISPTEGYGLQVFAGDSSLVFDSGYRTPQIKGGFFLNSSSYADTSGLKASIYFPPPAAGTNRYFMASLTSFVSFWEYYNFPTWLITELIAAVRYDLGNSQMDLFYLLSDFSEGTATWAKFSSNISNYILFADY